MFVGSGYACVETKSTGDRAVCVALRKFASHAPSAEAGLRCYSVCMRVRAWGGEGYIVVQYNCAVCAVSSNGKVMYSTVPWHRIVMRTAHGKVYYDS